jgi:hypothetical protein
MVLLCSCTHQSSQDPSDALLADILEIGVPASAIFPKQKTWSCAAKGVGPQALVSIDMDNAPIEKVLHEVLSASQISFRCAGLRIQGRHTLHLTDVPILDALRLLLHPIEAFAQWDPVSSPPLLSIRNRPLPAASGLQSFGPAAEKVAACLELNHLPVASLSYCLTGSTGPNAAGNIQGLWPLNSALASSALPESNRILFRGGAEDIQRTRRMSLQADRPPPKVRVELALYARRPQSRERSDSSSFQIPFGNSWLRWSPLDVYPTIAEFNFNRSAGHLEWVAWSGDQVATGRLVQHAEMVTQSGLPLNLTVGRTGYLLVTSESSGVPSALQIDINASSNLQVTPTALPGGSILLNLSYANARLSKNAILAGNTASRSQSATLIVPNGGYVAFGGTLFLQETVKRREPLWLRNLPIIRSLLSQSSDSWIDECTVQYVRVSLVDEPSTVPSGPRLPRIPLLDETEDVPINPAG